MVSFKNVRTSNKSSEHILTHHSGQQIVPRDYHYAYCLHRGDKAANSSAHQYIKIKVIFRMNEAFSSSTMCIKTITYILHEIPPIVCIQYHLFTFLKYYHFIYYLHSILLLNRLFFCTVVFTSIKH